MSLGSMIFNKNIWKFVLAISIPGAIIYFFWYSQMKADQELKDFNAEQKAHPTTDHVIINNYGMKEIDDSNHVRWQLTADQGLLMPNGKDVELKGVVVEYFEQQTGALKMRMTAPNGTANQETKFVKLTSENGKRVVADGGGFKKSHFECNAVELTKNNQFLASGGVTIDWPGVAKVRGDTAEGSTDMSSGPKNLRVKGNTHTLIGNGI